MFVTVCDFPADTDMRNPLRADLHHDIAGLDEPFGSRLQIRIGRHRLLFEPVQDRIVVQCPPIRTQFAIRRLRLDKGTCPMP